jgi:hypothetical protein
MKGCKDARADDLRGPTNWSTAFWDVILQCKIYISGLLIFSFLANTWSRSWSAGLHLQVQPQGVSLVFDSVTMIQCDVV